MPTTDTHARPPGASPPRHRVPWRGAPQVYWLVVACVSAVAALYWGAVNTEAGQAYEDAVLEGAAQAAGGLADTLARALLKLTPLVAFGALLGAVVVGRRRRGWATVVLAIGIVVVSAGIVQLLKLTLTRPVLLDVGVRRADQSFPSGHTALALSVYAATLLAIPARHRRTAGALVGLWALGVCLAVVAADWHRPSDVLAAALIVVAVAAPACALAAELNPVTDGPMPDAGRRVALVAGGVLPVAAASLVLVDDGPSALSLGLAAVLVWGTWTLLALWWLNRRG
ncbi:phosphatase PAP2 family protein [Catellatospora sichuanensis]|uniref:phosphatase PAP2 family protein n=1 Tax=Catellatospora sichuanensis TaxID=1969805 RepID=UPI001642B98E|nr:phosphatase PAP2 family protein [Catellatospora sichuanensis]